MTSLAPTIDRRETSAEFRQLVEALRGDNRAMLPHEATTAARVLFATGYRVNEYGQVVFTR